MLCDSSDVNYALWVCIMCILFIQDVLLASALWFFFFFGGTGELPILRFQPCGLWWTSHFFEVVIVALV